MTAQINHFGRPGTPSASRGLLGAISAGLGFARAAYGVIDANQKKQRNKGYISAAYRSGGARMDIRQQDIRQSTAESLNARGLGGSTSAVRAAMVGGKPISQGPAPTDLASQSATDLGKEFALDRSDLDQGYQQALNENKADALNAQIGSIASGVQTATSVYGAGKDLGAMKGAAPSAARQAYMSGIDDPANAWGGIHPVDPLNAPGSSWNRKGTMIGAGQANYDFNTGNG